MIHVTIYSWNVNGIRAAERKGLLDWLHAADADIVALQETKASERQVSTALREPPGYHADWCAAEKAGYSGVATFSKLAPSQVARGIGDPRFDGEGRVLISTFPKFTFYNVYFPSGSSGPERVAHKLAFYERFRDVIGAAITSGQRIVVVGDVNTSFAEIDLARPRENAKTSGFMPEERAALGELFAAGLVDTFRHVHPTAAKYSWWSQRTNARERNIGWRLDYILVSANLAPHIVAADIHSDVAGSDHCPVSLTLEVE
ncbi:MAG: exodeoxyribonuclease III [Chloroflexales bacterium]|nr:exodeoxyribonuclease III [Chloroflexales bacterium]